MQSIVAIGANVEWTVDKATTIAYANYDSSRLIKNSNQLFGVEK